jgi:hypothetical protein
MYLIDVQSAVSEFSIVEKQEQQGRPGSNIDIFPMPYPFLLSPVTCHLRLLLSFSIGMFSPTPF